jgi:hypothetical protein
MQNSIPLRMRHVHLPYWIYRQQILITATTNMRDEDNVNEVWTFRHLPTTAVHEIPSKSSKNAQINE